MQELAGLTANIQHYAVNDGPGIRTTVFMKGCPLRCKWCHNPEMIDPHLGIWYRQMLCTSCSKCIEVCSESAIEGFGDERVIDRNACNLCMKCVEVCPNHAMAAVGEQITVENALKEIRKDEIFYRRNNGGATLSGGEPLLQAHFVTELLKQCQDHLVHTVLDTCGYSSWDTMSKAVEYADLILFDIKHMDAAKHKWGTGVSNELILENARRLAKTNEMWVRVPIIPGFNDTEGELRDIAEFMLFNSLHNVDLLPYHTYAEGKYKMLGRQYELALGHPFDEEWMQDFQSIRYFTNSRR